MPRQKLARKLTRQVSPRSLADLPLGLGARVAAVDGSDGSRRRLLDLGFVPGTPVTAVLRNVSGDPTAYRLRGVTIALRAVDAAKVSLEALVPGDSPPGQESER